MKTLTFDKEKYLKLKNVYENEIKKGKTKDDLFIFEKQELLIGYAKYLLQYLEGKLNVR